MLNVLKVSLKCLTGFEGEAITLSLDSSIEDAEELTLDSVFVSVEFL